MPYQFLHHRTEAVRVRASCRCRSARRRLDEVQRGEFDLPAGCSITYELAAMDFLRAMLRERPGQSELEAFYHDFKLRNGVRPTAAETAHADFDPSRTGHGGWFEFVRDMGDIPAGGVLTTHGELLNMLGNARFNNADPLLVLKAASKTLDEGMNLDRLRGTAEGLSMRWPELGRMDDERFDEGLQSWLMTPHFVAENNRLALARSDKSNALSNLIEELVDWRMTEFLTRSSTSAVVREDEASWSAGPELWRAYMREENCQVNSRGCTGLSTRVWRSRHRPAPDRFRACAQHAQRAAAQQMPLDVERVVDSCVRFKKPLRGRPALEALHLALSPSN